MSAEVTQPTAVNTPTEEQIVRGFTNDPVLATDTFTLGDRTFPVLDLSYDDYTKFVLLMQPLIDVLKGSLMSAVGTKADVDIPGILLGADVVSVSAIMRYCAVSLPEMVRLMCKPTDPSLTIEDVKKLGKSPFNLAKIVMKQIIQNGMIKDFTDFFGLMVRLMKSAKQS